MRERAAPQWSRLGLSALQRNCPIGNRSSTPPPDRILPGTKTGHEVVKAIDLAGETCNCLHMQLSTWFAFVLLAVVIAYSPGPISLLCISSGVRCGFVRSLPLVAGCSLSYILLMTAACVGLGAVVQSSMVVFQCLKWGGAAYLFYLGWKNWRSRTGLAEQAAQVRVGCVRRQFASGFFTGISNPKAILTFTALFPQFIDPAGDYVLQFFVMGASFFVIQIVSSLTFAASGAKIVEWLRRRKLEHLQGRVTGGILFVAGGALALARR